MKSVYLLLNLIALVSVVGFSSAAEREGILPKGDKGQLLNLGFEEGTLKDWSATGNAFDRQPIRGDTVAPRRGDMRSDHDGQYWVGTYERLGDASQGTLTSVPFTVTHPYASFLVAGGSRENTRVELVRADNQKVIFKINGSETENLRPVVVDLREQQGKKIFIRLVDQDTAGWGHINFDDFRFHSDRPKFANEIDPAKQLADAPPPMDDVKYAGLPPEEAAAAATIPPGFTLKLFAGEPDVKQPIAFDIDDRGRLWVAEAYTYPIRAKDGQGKDRILIFEDTDGDGKFDKRTVFMEHLNLVSGMALGYGGVWVGAAPYLMFIPDRDHDDKPDGEPEIVLDGWAYQDTHETLNTFTWGPDGWLYGCQGVFTHSRVGKPGAPASERTSVNAAVWRYHPTKKKFEIFAEGTSNPWGVDFDAHGQCWIEACVIPHLFHMIEGARYERQAGESFNPNTYDEIKTVADHLHYAGNKGPHAANGRSDAAGGGHAHAGMMVYLGGSFPEKYKGQLFMNNIHGQRLNMDIPERRGSGFVGHHGADFVNFNDRWSQIINMLYDQDGSVYMIDWYDKNQCHHTNPEGHDRSNGRIFKLIYNNQKFTPIDLQKKSNLELVQLLTEKNEFYARHARRILAERGKDPAVYAALKEMIHDGSDDVQQLHALWTLQVTGGLDEEFGLSLLQSPHEYVRAWAIQLISEEKGPSDAALKEFAKVAVTDPSPVVRLYLASAMERTEPEKRWDVITALLKHGEDVDDHNLPLLYWYATEGAVAADPQRGVKLLTETQIPKVRQFIARRITTLSKTVAVR
ncbi:MAG TPA: PVC-type heme-binding CxxCH protein [Verrucomicrobiae bacterium]|jgi:putative membrane-bound dehydrogenase-like protein|nr:PVC-type heme-binding CxxCH protein [Verrucomicrobiae bacterium]